MTLKKTLLAATLLASSLVAAPIGTALAQPVSGLYVGAGAGVNFLMNQTQSARTQPFTIFGGEGSSNISTSQIGPDQGRVNGSINTGAQAGFAGLGSVGWGFGNGIRVEMEGSYRYNALNNGSRSGRLNAGGTIYPFESPSSSLKGNSNQYAVMVNALFDFDIGRNWVYPYMGGGVGYAWQNINGLRAGVSGNVASGAGGSGINWSSGGTAGAFAYQAIAGAAFPIAPVPGLSVTLEYRFLGTAGAQNISARGSGGFEVINVANGGGPVTTAHVTAAYNHAVMLGVRYAFNAAPPAVVTAAPAPAMAGKSFLVFFDWDKSTLSDRARSIIQDAAATAKSTQHTQIEVNGYADTSGTPAYNKGLSMRRAQAVAAELVRLGVGKTEIAIKAFGDTVLLVPTGPGVREPQNRRVEIIIR